MAGGVIKTQNYYLLTAVSQQGCWFVCNGKVKTLQRQSLKFQREMKDWNGKIDLLAATNVDYIRSFITSGYSIYPIKRSSLEKGL